jgi:hypothetical protein
MNEGYTQMIDSNMEGQGFGQDEIPSEILNRDNKNYFEFLISKTNDGSDHKLLTDTFILVKNSFIKNRNDSSIVLCSHVVRELIDLTRFGKANKSDDTCDLCYKEDKYPVYRDLAKKVFGIDDYTAQQLISFKNYFSQIAHFRFNSKSTKGHLRTALKSSSYDFIHEKLAEEDVAVLSNLLHSPVYSEYSQRDKENYIFIRNLSDKSTYELGFILFAFEEFIDQKIRKIRKNI